MMTGVAARVVLACALLISQACANVSLRTGFRPIIRSGDTVGGSPWKWGLALDTWEEVIMEAAQDGTKGTKERVSVNPDWSAVLRAGSRTFIVSVFESPNPASMYLLEVEQDGPTGDMIPISMQASASARAAAPAERPPLLPRGVAAARARRFRRASCS